MKLKNSISLLFMIMITMLSCKKNEVKTESVTLADELKGSVWAGEFRYTAGAYQGLQPFSAGLNSDGTLTWTDFQNTRAGGTWLIEGNKINLRFPNGTTNSADVTSKQWSNFTNPGGNGFEIANVSRSAVPIVASLEQTKWTGKFTNSMFGTYNGTINFGSGKTLTISAPDPFKETYTIEGAGFRTPSFGYFIFLNNATNIKGYNHFSDVNVTWNLTKQ